MSSVVTGLSSRDGGLSSKSVVKKKARKSAVVLSAVQRRTSRQFLASIAAGFLPIASYVLMHFEAPDRPWLYGLVMAALVFSAPTLAE